MTRNINFWTLFQCPALVWEMFAIENGPVCSRIYESPFKKNSGVEVSIPVPLLHYIFHRCQNIGYLLKIHVLIWQVSLQLRGGDSRQIWKWFTEPIRYFCEIKYFLLKTFASGVLPASQALTTCKLRPRFRWVGRDLPTLYDLLWIVEHRLSQYDKFMFFNVSLIWFFGC